MPKQSSTDGFGMGPVCPKNILRRKQAKPAHVESQNPKWIPLALRMPLFVRTSSYDGERCMHGTNLPARCTKVETSMRYFLFAARGEKWG